jgi:hypothetical protein
MYEVEVGGRCNDIDIVGNFDTGPCRVVSMSSSSLRVCAAFIIKNTFSWLLCVQNLW